jgi:hypothetical protein
LAIDGTDWRYNIYNKLRKNVLPRVLKTERIEVLKFYSSTVNRSFERLEERGFVTIDEHPTKSEKGRPKFLCYLTLLGLLHALEFRKELWGYIDEIAVKHADKLPLIFGEWKHFKEKGVESKVVEAMKIFCKMYVPRLYAWRGLDNANRLLCEDLTRHVLYFHLTLITLPPLDKASEQTRRRIYEREKTKTFDWVKVLLRNERLGEYLTKELDEDEREHENRLKGIRLVRKYIRDLGN